MRIFFDMDGTLAVYPSTTEPWWEVKDIFKYLAPIATSIKAAKRLIEAGYEVYILSAYNANFPQTMRDKDYWLDKYLPEVDADHRIYTLVGQSKAEAVPGGIQSDDILIDDYNKNLETWADAGGIGVKLLNGLNNRKTWSGISVRANGTIKQIVDVLTSLATSIEDEVAQ